MAGGVIMVIAMVVVFPIILMVSGAVWSACFGWVLTDAAEAATVSADG